MRLVDADLLIDYIQSDKSGLCAAREFEYDYIECINAQPTAYDTEKVVAKLEKEARMLYSIHAFEPVSAWETKDILPIVKGGGIDDI